jgi:hypothetical protein
VTGSVTRPCYNSLKTSTKEAGMTDFTITEDFPKSEIEFDQRFLDPKACYDYLFKQKWLNGFV